VATEKAPSEDNEDMISEQKDPSATTPVQDKAESERPQFRWKKISRPKKWRSEVDNVKQPCWCGEEWDDHHEDGDHEPIWVKVSIDPVLGKRKTFNRELI
jgi:hypothetical protein